MLDLKNISILHQEALRIARVLSENEYLMIEVLQKIDDQKIYRFLKFKSLFQYATLGLRLSDERAYNFIRVARKAREVSKLQEALKTGQVTLSKARKIDSRDSDSNKDQSQRLVPKKLLRTRKPIPAMTKHKASLRDDRKCQDLNPDGTRCNDSRWVDIHHVIPVSYIGQMAKLWEIKLA
jgi:hypothetical protein